MTIAFLKGHLVARYVRSLAPLTPLTHSVALHFAPLALLARSIHGLTHFAHSLVGQLKFMKVCSHCDHDQREGLRSALSLETRPLYLNENAIEEQGVKK